MELETLTQNFKEEDFVKARREIDRVGLISHFGGEIILIGSVVMTIGNGSKLDLKTFGAGALAYILLQIPAFFAKGVSLNNEQNYGLAKKFEKKSREENKFLGWIDKNLSKMHDYFAKNGERYLLRYMNIRRKR